MVDFLREQSAIEKMLSGSPEDARESAKFLTGELRWQFRLAMLVFLNVIVTAFAIILLYRAYSASQSSLRNVQALSSDILGSMEQAVITTDINGVVTSINKRGEEFLEADSDCVGQTINDLAPNSLCSYYLDWLDEKQSSTYDEFSVQINGNLQTFLATCESLNDQNSNEIGAVIQLQDITEHKLIEDRMRRMERYMGLGSVAAGLHHEIKNPLAALSLHVQLLEEQLEADEPSEEIKTMLSVIGTEINRIGGVLEGFRDFASIGNFELSDVNLLELIQNQIAFIRPQATSKKIEIELVRCEPTLQISANRVRIEQVLLNLIINAMEAMRDGGKISVSAFEQGENVLITVADSGTGILNSLQDRVFDPYFTTKNSGTGLGLALCDKIMRQHDGSIDFQTSDAGTTFVLTFSKQKTQ